MDDRAGVRVRICPAGVSRRGPTGRVVCRMAFFRREKRPEDRDPTTSDPTTNDPKVREIRHADDLTRRALRDHVKNREVLCRLKVLRDQMMDALPLGPPAPGAPQPALPHEAHAPCREDA